MDSIKTGNLIAERRKEKNMTQRDLAGTLHISDRTVSKWERGAGFPDVSLLEPLADALGLTVTELLHGERNEILGADNEVRYALKVVRQYRREMLKRNIRDVVLAVFCIVVLGFFIFAFAERWGAFSEDIYLELEAGLYIDGLRVEDTKVIIEGSKNKLRNEFNGRLAIDWLEKTCRDKTKVNIVWSESGQHIVYYGYGQIGFVPLGNNCYFSFNMMSFAIENSEEGWVIATHDYLAELMALEGYYPLIEPGHHFY